MLISAFEFFSLWLIMYRIVGIGIPNSIAPGKQWGLLKFFVRISREGPKLLLKVALGVVLFVSITLLGTSLRILGTTFDLGHFTTTDSVASENLTEIIISPSDGLRMVVFGGGDIATPPHDQGQAWTKIMCQKLGCDTYVSFVPEADDLGGAVVSTPLLEAAYNRLSALYVAKDNSIELDYSWIKEQYVKPYRHDLAAQVDDFLLSSRARGGATESLWVFNVGYWDIWYLAALPLKLATEVIDSDILDLFFQIERLYQAVQGQESIAFPDADFGPGNPSHIRPEDGSGETTRIPFRIFLTRLFDISLSPGFRNTRPCPPSPHLRSTQLRNAAYLTKYWNVALGVAADDWLATPDPEYWSTADTMNIEVVEALAGKRPLQVEEPERGSKAGKYHRDQDNRKQQGNMISLPRRKIASYATADYLRELMIDRQLRNADLVDHNGLGARPPKDGFLDVSMPCTFRITAGDVFEHEEGVPVGDKTVVCRDPDNYLFYTGFTVGRRAIYEVGVRAARSFLDQVEATSAWREKAMMQEESIRKDKGPDRTA
ncbi:hypothetical protein F4802DRAFT_581458 [Xylaria palmicola]|nr:hypothetical protein F4802DRAFT_581458 [Xylaria palmicola]